MKQKIFFDRISLSSLPVVFFHLLRGDDVHYWRYSRILALIFPDDFLGIIPADCKNIDKAVPEFYDQVEKWGYGLMSIYREHDLYPDISEALGVNGVGQEKRFYAIMQRWFFNLSYPTAEAMMIYKNLKVKYPEMRLFFLGKYFDHDHLARIEPEMINDCPWWIAAGDHGMEFLTDMGKCWLRRIKKTVLKIFEAFNVRDSSERFCLDWLRRWQTIFFPHQGIYFGDNIFKKDHFYIDDPQSPFHLSRILHLSLGEKKKILKPSFQYYRERHVSYADFMSFITVFDSLNVSFKYVNLIWLKKNGYTGKRLRGNDFKAIRLYGLFFKEVFLYQKALTRLPSVKWALIGFEDNFSQTLLLALTLRGIKTIAIQERFLYLAGGCAVFSIALDHYFVIGTSVVDTARSYSKLFPGTSATLIGPVRKDLIDDEKKFLKQDEKYLQIKKKYFLMLVLPFHAYGNNTQDRFHLANNARNLMIFFDAMIKLAQKFPGVYFTVKFKMLMILKNPYYAAIIRNMESLDNVCIERDMADYTPYKLAALADGAIMMSTSLCQEMLAVGKPVINYDYFGMPASYYDYEGYPVIAKSYNELEQMTARMVDGTLWKPGQMEEMQKDIFGSITMDVSIKQRLHNELALLEKCSVSTWRK